ncbi:MAG: PIG-L family deacetylase [Candidatus Caldatribacteriota bacterium]|jgi:LmbE family N-acetylglucosaminyl deacetylase|nr:PIG-L family deacetylase [Atribacterota bacterium]MDD3031930.1 PIG-L family deacetylase [Atribacterota bacterium]MDD3641771.1 PIG-L family deacetylase [Atribacterota bacterium]MDD4288108.1 PIG-L family deacetylase [Atribacterota bacterium]MDD4764853.1 PIG-L family deacetylase [Atribacterota bacterium]
MATIIVFGTEPDQAEAGMGGAILKLTESAHQVTIIDLTNGEFSKNHQTDYRKREAIKASRILGIDERITLDYLYPELKNNIEIREEITEIYENTNPDIIFIPYPVKFNPESKIASEICNSSLSYLYQQNAMYIKEKIFYYFATPFNYFEKPDFIVDISKEIEMKVEALKCYESRFGKNLQDSPLFENTLNLSRYYGMLIGTKFGESFICKDPLEIRNIDSII